MKETQTIEVHRNQRKRKLIFAIMPVAQASPEAPGFEMVLGIVGVSAIWQILSAKEE